MGYRLFSLILLAVFAAAPIHAATAWQIQQQPAPALQQPPGTGGTIERIAVVGNQRVEAATVASYLSVRAGDPFDPALLDQSLKTLFATGLFADVVIERNGNTLLIRVSENPIINRIVFEGNSRLDRDELLEEVQLRPRMIYTRARVRSDMQRIIELYRRSGRFAAVVDPKIIQRDQNRVDLVFEIAEGPKSRVSRINFIGNEQFSDRELRGELATNEARWWKIFSGNDTYDPDRLSYDRELLRQFYLSNGYADFRIVSAVAELTPDQRDFFVTFVVEEGDVYSFGEVSVVSEVEDLDSDFMRAFVNAVEGDTYDASAIEGSIENMTNVAGVLGFAFLDIRPRITRNRAERTLDVEFRILEAPRAYIERININGNLRTRDYVIRREFRLAEGDAYNSSRIQRSEARLRQLGFFRDITFEESQGSQPDRVIVDVTVEEQATGELSLGAGYSSLENFLFDFSIRERNFIGKGQSMQLGVTISSLRRQVQLSFTEPYLFGRQVGAGVDLFRTEFENSLRSSFSTTSTGGSLRLGIPLDELVRLGLRYTLRQDQVDVRGGLFTSPFILAAIGTNTTSSIGYNITYDTVNNFLRPTRGTRFIIGQDLAGLGGNVKYLRNTMQYDFYRRITGDFIFHLGAEAGYIEGLGQNVRINDRFFLGGPTMRGFANVGIGPRDTATGDFLGGNAYYVGTAAVTIPLGAAAEELGFQVSVFVDVGSLGRADLRAFDNNGNPIDNSSVFSNGSPRVAAGVGVAWESPFGPFRIDLAHVIRKQPFDETESLQFNVGTTF